MNETALNAMASAEALAQGLVQRGLGGCVFSPGSRNAPLIQAFKAFNLPGGVALDERSAAHHALGMSIGMGKPVAACCTSGTAALNHGPALAEAHRCGLPLISLTADRPEGAHLAWQSQTLAQKGMHALHTHAHFQWTPQNTDDANDLLDKMSQALEHGPIHVNCPFDEPLYGNRNGQEHAPETGQTPSRNAPLADTATPDISAFTDRLQQAAECGERILLLGGTQHQLLSRAALLKWASHAVVAGDPTSGLDQAENSVITACDRWLSTWTASGRPWKEVHPDLVVTFGAPLLSRKLLATLAGRAPEHWHIDGGGSAPTAFGAAAHNVPCKVDRALVAGAQALDGVFTTHDLRDRVTSWRETWWALENQIRANHPDAVVSQGWSDLQAHSILNGALPNGWDLHLGNSTPVRYRALFDVNRAARCWSNRGAAGIDGCTSTAVGSAMAGRDVTLITGELGFLYDANAFHLHPLPSNLRIAVIHNGGGGIFRWLDGPKKTGLMESHFEWRHDTELRPLCDLHGLIHERVENEGALRAALKRWWFPAEAPKVLEIATPREESAAAYFRYLEAVRV